jgi:hypothetical protein
VIRIRAVAREWTRALSLLPPERRRWGIVALLGWWLSPLTAWNDAFTNIPLALGAAYLLGVLGIPVDPKAAAVTAYIFTNVLGIALLWIGAGKLIVRRPRVRRAINAGWFLRAGLRIAVYACLVYLTVWSIERMLAR